MLEKDTVLYNWQQLSEKGTVAFFDLILKRNSQVVNFPDQVQPE